MFVEAAEEEEVHPKRRERRVSGWMFKDAGGRKDPM